MQRPNPAQAEPMECLRLAISGRTSDERAGLEPSWEEFVKPLALPAQSSQALIASLKRLWLLPFADLSATVDLLLFRYTRLPKLRSTAVNRESPRFAGLCALYELLLEMALQGNSVFPQNPAHLAQQVRQALENPQPVGAELDPLLNLLVSPDGSRCQTGFNFARVTELDEVVSYEHNRRAGSPEWCWKAAHKYNLFTAEVRSASQFRDDWLRLKQQFKTERYQDSQGIIRRSAVVEGNWRKPSFSDLRQEDSRFQVVFDFFCWKWFLYGMHGDEPMVQKLAVTLTPFGTQIFIPGFWSLDPSRDIDWAKVTRLHRARGIRKQGEKLIGNRKAYVQLLKRISQADQSARGDRLRGEARYDYIKRAAGLVPEVDNAEVRRYLRAARKSGGSPV